MATKEAWEILSYLFYHVIHRIYSICQSLSWKMNDTTNSATKYSNCAHVLNVLWRGRMIMSPECTKRDFLCCHSEFSHPRIVLDEKVTLYTLNQTEAVFVRTDICVYDSDVHPFMIEAQFKHAKKIIVIPILHFRRLAEEIGDPRVPVIFLFNTARCGSTLLTQMFEAMPGGISMSEPYWLKALAILAKQGVEIRTLLQSCVRIMCKPVKSGSLYCFKAFGYGVDLMPHVVRNVPYCRVLYMYRENPMKTVVSIVRMAKAVPVFTILCKAMASKRLRTIWPSLANFQVNTFCYPELYPWSVTEQPYTLTELLCIHLAMSRKFYVNVYENVAGVRYEDILRNPSYACGAIARYCGLPVKQFVENATVVLQRDSQRGSAFDQEQVKHIEYDITNVVKENVHAVADRLAKYGIQVTRPGDKWCLPNTISKP